MTDHLEAMMLRQLAFQRRLGHDFNQMNLAERVSYVAMNQQAAVAELVEALAETSWKPWADGDWLNTEAFLAELTDVTCFLLNMYLAVLATPAEVDARHAAKVDVNHRRQDEGYTGRDKCETCGRAPDEPPTSTILDLPTSSNPTYGTSMS